MNTQNEDGNDMDIALVKYKYMTRPNEATEDTPKRVESTPEESEPQYYFQVQSAR